MAHIADKARFYLERAVPQLREFEEKEIFTKDEIRTLVTKRTDFEHTILSPRATPADFLRYAAWESSLESLRAARCRRLGIHSSSSAAGRARLFSIHERSVSRHPGELGAWLAYLDCLAQARATRRWRRVAARALRLHPGCAQLWTLAGRRAAKDGDMSGARGFFMRGCRFCNGADVWVEYARCEMEWLGKMEAKKGNGNGTRPVAVVEKQLVEETDEDGNLQFDEDSGDEDEEGELVLPNTDAEFRQDKKTLFGEDGAQKLEQRNPALDGAIPLAIFDIARKQPLYTLEVAEAFFDVFADFPKVSSQPKMLQHVLDAMMEEDPNSPATCSCLVRQPMIGMDPHTADFPKALKETLARLRSGMDGTTDKAVLASKTMSWIEPVLAVEDLDVGLRSVLEHITRKLEQPCL